MRKIIKNLAVVLTIIDIYLYVFIVFIVVALYYPTCKQSRETFPNNASGWPIYTYAYADARGDGITSTCGQSMDGVYYIIDETVIIGPYLEKPDVQIPVLCRSTRYTFKTEELNGFSEDMSGGIGHGISDCGKEIRVLFDNDTFAEFGLARFEDGEIYIYINFLQNIENLGGSRYAAKELDLKRKEDRTAEEQGLFDAYKNLLEKGRQDYRLYSHSEFFSRSDDDYDSAITYSPDHASVIGYNPKKFLKYNFSQRH